MTNNVGGEFRVSGILKLRSRRGIYVCGEIISGSLSAGMVIVWPVHGRALTMDVPIRGVEFVDYSPGVAAVALAVQFDESELEHEQLLRDLLEVGMVVEIAPLNPIEPASPIEQ